MLMTDRKEGKRAAPSPRHAHDQAASLATAQLANMGQVINIHIKAVNWVVRIQELQHTERPEQARAQGQGKARVGDDVPMAVHVGGTTQELCRAQPMPRPSTEQVLTHYLLFLSFIESLSCTE